MRLRGASLSFGPKPLYPLKAAATRVGSVLWLLRLGGQSVEDGLRILLYHRVSPDRDPLSVSPRGFRAQMDVLADRGFQAFDIVDAASRLLADPPAARGIVGLSFDDGYADVVEHALPALQHHGFRATVFVATGLIDRTAKPDWYERPPPLLRWHEIAELDRLGTLRFEAHSVTHRNLTRLNHEEARHEIVDSKHALERQLGREVEAFSYPGGVLGERERTLVEEAGYRFAVSCEPGINRPGCNRFALSRTQIDARDGLLDFRAKLGGGHDSGLPGRTLYRRARYGAPRLERVSSLTYRSR
jgi:peptidoglycan/xylan/chitin deacetylase (PgdA/CDA1 family)